MALNNSNERTQLKPSPWQNQLLSNDDVTEKQTGGGGVSVSFDDEGKHAGT